MQHDAENGTAFDGRWRWLGRPWFLVAVALLALNDHVFKSQVPGWWTGKLSDVAGVVVLATLLAVLLGPRRALALTGIGFVALKVVPGVAELATPFLGGETLRDATDLVALVALVPLAVVMVGRPQGRISPRWATVLPVAGAAAAVLTATATSCGQAPAVLEVLVQDGTFYALTDDWELEWSTSRDGVDWEPSERPPLEYGLQSQVRYDEDGYGPYIDTYADPGPVGPQEVCAGDGTCYRLVDRRLIERRRAGGTWTADFRLSRAEEVELTDTCAGGRRGALSSIALLDTDDGGHDVVATLGSFGVLRRGAEGTWIGHSVASVAAPTVEGVATTAELILALAMTPLWLAAMAVVFAVGRRRGWRALTAALSVMAGSWVLAVGSTAVYSWVVGVGVHPSRIAVAIGTLALLGSTGVALVVGPGDSRAQSPAVSPP